MLLLTAVLCAGCSPRETTPEAETPAHHSPGQTSSELIIICDNNPFDSRLYTVWGFSCLVRLLQKAILFDTGGDSSTFTVAERVGLPLLNVGDVTGDAIRQYDLCKVGLLGTRFVTEESFY
jgi:hypothetical protein